MEEELLAVVVGCTDGWRTGRRVGRGGAGPMMSDYYDTACCRHANAVLKHTTNNHHHQPADEDGRQEETGKSRLFFIIICEVLRQHARPHDGDNNVVTIKRVWGGGVLRRVEMM